MVSQNDMVRPERPPPAYRTAQGGSAPADTGERRYRISELAKEFGVTPRALRFYEAQGLLNPERRGQHRLYTQRDRARLAWILRGKRVGFSLAEIGELLKAFTQLIEEVLADPSCEEEARRRFHEATGGAVGKPVPKERLEAALKQIGGTRPRRGNGARRHPAQ